MVRVKETVDVNMPLESCYKLWADVASYPRFMQGLKSVRPKGDPNVWHFEMQGPDGQVMQWDSQMDALKHHNRMVSWHTIRNADLPHSGAITFEPIDAPGGGTRAQMVVDSEILAGADPKAFEQFLKHAIQATLTAFKSLVEEQAPISY